MANQVARFEVGGGRDFNDADGTSLKRLADLKRRNVALLIRHAPAHIRVNGHPQIADLQLTLAGFTQTALDEFEILLTRKSNRTAFQAKLTRCGRHILRLVSYYQ